MSNPFLMQELESIGDITNNKACFIFGEVNSFLDVR